MPTNERKTLNDIAESLGTDPNILRRLCVKHGIKKEAGGYLVSDVLRAKAAAASANTRNALPDGDPRKRKVELENRLLEIKIDENERRLVDAEAVDMEAQRIGTAIRNDILALPQSLAPRLAGKTDLAEIAQVLDSGLRDCLRHLAEAVECPTPAP